MRVAEFAHDPACGGIVVTADLQSCGRGQHGRVWESPPGVNVLLSTLLFPPPELRRPALLTAFAAVSVTETILEVTGQHSTIKWPNDVLLSGKKVCGILIECGVGIRSPKRKRGNAASLACARLHCTRSHLSSASVSMSTSPRTISAKWDCPTPLRCRLS